MIECPLEWLYIRENKMAPLQVPHMSHTDDQINKESTKMHWVNHYQFFCFVFSTCFIFSTCERIHKALQLKEGMDRVSGETLH